MAELLIELFSEEIPARMQDQAREDLARLVGDGLKAADLPASAIRTYATPRRLVLVADGVAQRQPDRVVERRGPRVDAPDAARQGFLASLGEASYRLEERDEGKKGRVVYALIEQPGAAAASVVRTIVEDALERFPWPKSMRWGDGQVRWVRPLKSIICLLDGEVVEVRFGEVVAGRTTRGHRFMAPEPFEVSGFADYAARLIDAFVIFDQDVRGAAIEERAHALAADKGLTVAPDPGLFRELRGLVEWPVPLMGRIGADFMELPPEVLVTSMRQHQKFLATRTAEGALADRFITVANRETADGGIQVTTGNERVLRARLFDARFFWAQDRKVRLESRLPALGKMVFHAELGTLEAKVQRMVALVGTLATYVPGARVADAERAALLAKCDLVTGMVGEFPELQGLMGAYYARHQGEDEAVIAAIGEHYSPKGPDDACPAAPASVLVALADRLDTLAGFFAVDIKPTGSKDPFALRRAALGVIRLILENRLRLPLATAIDAALAGYGTQLPTTPPGAVRRDLLGFIADRLEVQQRAAGTRHDLIKAVLAAGGGDDLVRVLARVAALQAFLQTDDGANLLAAYRRAANIVRIEEKKDKAVYAGSPDPALLVDPAEKELAMALLGADGAIGTALRQEDDQAAMVALAGLRGPLDRFFDQVLVNVDDPAIRRNRLLLLSTIRAALGAVADFGMVEDIVVQPGRVA